MFSKLAFWRKADTATPIMAGTSDLLATAAIMAVVGVAVFSLGIYRLASREPALDIQMAMPPTVAAPSGASGPKKTFLREVVVYDFRAAHPYSFPGAHEILQVDIARRTQVIRAYLPAAGTAAPGTAN
jgi:hypothetical protein